jgi:hypothetical protein
MIKNSKIYIFFSFVIFGAYCYPNNNVTKQKLNLFYTEHNKKFCKILDIASIDDADNIGCEFFISFDPSVKYQMEDDIQVPMLKKTGGMLMRLPYISPYGYMPPSPLFKEGLALILLTPEMLDKIIPSISRTAISQKLNINKPNEFILELKKRNTFVNAVILGDRVKSGGKIENGPANGIYNMRYHSWVALSQNYTQARAPHDPNVFHMFKIPDFNIPIDMGFFSPRGVMHLAENPANTISLNQLKEQNVYWHNALSPDNARFKIDTNKDLSSFWAVAISPNKQHINVTYFLIANTDRMSIVLQSILSSSNNLAQLANYLPSFKIKYNWVSNEDFQTLSTWVNTIVNAVSEAPAFSVAQPVPIVKLLKPVVIQRPDIYPILKPSKAKPSVTIPPVIQPKKINLQVAEDSLINLNYTLNSLSLLHY